MKKILRVVAITSTVMVVILGAFLWNMNRLSKQKAAKQEKLLAQERDCLLYTSPSGENVLVTVEKMKDEDGRFIENCPHPKQKIHVLFSQKPDELDLIRVREEQ